MFDSTFTFVDEIDIFSEDYEEKLDIYNSNFRCDTASGLCFFRKDSLKSGEYTLRIKTVFSKELIFSLSIFKDTVFHLKNELEMRSVKLIEKKELLDVDTIEIVCIIEGCFNRDVEKTMLIKNRTTNNYTVQTTSGKQNPEGTPIIKTKWAKHFIIDSLFNLQTESIKQQEEVYDAVINWRRSGSHKFLLSPTDKRCYILAGDKVLSFRDYGSEGWSLYNRFRKRYID